MQDADYRLLGDVGGTNARFALQARPGAPPEAIDSFRCADFPSLEAVIRHYLDLQAPRRPVQAAIGIANPIVGDQIAMTNHAWQFSIEALRRSLGWQRLVFVNDFAALALSLPTLRPDEIRQVGGTTGDADAPLALLGPGTGLGVSGLMRGIDGKDRVISGEGGHVTLAAADDEEAQVIAALRLEFGHVSAERVLSGPGLRNLYRSWCAVHGQAAEELTPAQIGERAMARGDAACEATLEMFLSLLGNVAGNLALTLGARGGVYIGGGIVSRWGGRLEASAFRRRFEDKGRFAQYLRPIPVWIIQPGGDPALRGAARALEV